jgi:hypothetical protein
MDWKTLLGNAYVDGMTEEEAMAKFNELYMTRADHEKESNVLQNKVDTLSSQVAENKRKERERMSEEERLKADQQSQWDSLIAENEELKKNSQIRDVADQYKERGFDKEFALETATALLNGDTATVLSNEKIFSDKQTAALRSSWEKEYNVNPPAGNGTGKVDYSAQIAEAQENGDMVAYASLIRQQNEANQQ